MKKVFVTLIGLFSLIVSVAQQSDSAFIEGGTNVNKFDNKHRAQGYWKIMLPDELGHFRSYEEGFFYNGKRIGVWYRKNYKHAILEMNIFYDTSQFKREQFKYHSNGVLKEHGYYELSALGKKESYSYVDAATNQIKTTVWDSTEMKEGLWTYKYENGSLMKEGAYRKDKQIGYWKYYAEDGSLLRVEDFNDPKTTKN